MVTTGKKVLSEVPDRCYHMHSTNMECKKDWHLKQSERRNFVVPWMCYIIVDSRSGISELLLECIPIFGVVLRWWISCLVKSKQSLNSHKPVTNMVCVCMVVCMCVC